MEIDVLIEDDGWRALDIETLAMRAAQETLARLGLDPDRFGVSLLACDDLRIAALNADFRGKPVPTNVLSWPAEDRAPPHPGTAPDRPDPAPDPQGTEELGDIAIALQTCLAEAAAAQKSPGDHVTHLLVHGVLHLLGYDHICDADAALMEGLEVEILATLGVADPYSD